MLALVGKKAERMVCLGLLEEESEGVSEKEWDPLIWTYSATPLPMLPRSIPLPGNEKIYVRRSEGTTMGIRALMCTPTTKRRMRGAYTDCCRFLC